MVSSEYKEFTDGEQTAGRGVGAQGNTKLPETIWYHQMVLVKQRVNCEDGTEEGNLMSYTRSERSL